METTWRRVLALGAALIVVAIVGGPSVRPMVRAATAIMLLVVGYRTVRANPGPAATPWRITLAGGALAVLSAAVRLVHGAVIGVDYAYPSPADLLAYAAYCFMIAGGLAFVRARTRERYRADMVDSIVVALAVGLFVYAFVLSEYVVDTAVPAFDRAGNVGYSVLTVTLLATVVRVSFGPGVRNASYYTLAVAVSLIVINDILLLLDTIGTPGVFTVSSIAAPTAFVLAAVAISHPGGMQLADRPAYQEQRLSPQRIALLLGAVASAPTLLTLDHLRDSTVDMAVLLSVWVMLAFGVVLRLMLLVMDRDRTTRRERALRDLAATLTTMQTTDDIIAAALTTGAELASRRSTPHAALYMSAGANGFLAVEARGDDRPLSKLTLAAGGEGASILEGAARDGVVRSLEGVTPLEAPGLSPDYFVVIAPVPQRSTVDRLLVVTSRELIGREQISALEALGAHLGLALDGVEAAEQAHQRRSNRRFRALVENSSDVVIVTDVEGEALFVSPTVRRLLGREESEVVGRPLIDMVARQDHISVRRLLAAPSRTVASHASVEVRMLHGTGDMRWFELEARDLTHDPEVAGIVVTASDVSDRKRAEAQLLRSEARFRLLVQNTSDVVAIVDDNSLISYVSPSVQSMLGFGIADVLGRNIFELLSVTEAERVRAMNLEGVDGSTIEVRVQGGDGKIRVVEVAITDMRHQPEVDGTVLNIRDVTERKSLEDDLRHQALHDDLTGLANRTLFADRVSEAVNASARTTEMVAVLFVDLDDFKLINDSLGHVVGDQVLVSVAHRIQQCLRLSDLAARLGGDEFAVLLTGVHAESEITEVADRVREAIGQPITVGDHDFRITASIGVVIDTAGDRSGEDLLRSADLAMYQAKQAGKDRHQLFESQMEESAVQELELKSALLRAVENQEFVLHYQPIVEMGTARIKGVEALLRWEDPHRGMVSPASFIPAAEETGLIREIGMWVAEQASSDLARWREMGHDLYCSINVSGRQMVEEDFAERLVETIAASGVTGDSIVVELTESVLAVPGTKEMFDVFHNHGYRVALDDFGTGYSALQYLQTFDIDIIKIDRSFVTALGQTKDTSVVQAVLDVAASIEATTLAEGIEDTNEVRLLKSLGVELGQGYYYSRPVPEAQLLELLADEFATKQ